MTKTGHERYMANRRLLLAGLAVKLDLRIAALGMGRVPARGDDIRRATSARERVGRMLEEVRHA